MKRLFASIGFAVLLALIAGALASSAHAEPVGTATCDGGSGTLTQDIYTHWTSDADGGLSSPLSATQAKMVCSQVWAFVRSAPDYPVDAGGGGLPSGTVIPIADGGTGVASLACLPGQSVTADGGTMSCINPAYPNRYPSDSSDLLVLALTESTPPLLNTGSAGSNGNLNSGAAGLLYAVRGLFSDGSLYADSTVAAGVIATSSASIEAPYPVTASIWIRPQTQVVGPIFSKEYHASGSWSAPYSALEIYTTDTSGSFECAVTVSGTQHTVTNTSNFSHLQLQQWNHIGCTYDGATLILYLNGEVINTLAVSGAIDYGAHGTWAVFEPLLREEASVHGTWNSYIQDARFASVRTISKLVPRCLARGDGVAAVRLDNRPFTIGLFLIFFGFLLLVAITFYG